MPLADLFADLTDAQREAVVHTDGPLLVLAGAGSGKTRVITRRAAHLAATVARPDQILAITFTNKAAGEMRERIEGLGVPPGIWACTFHSLCARLLRTYGSLMGIQPNFTIFDDADQRGLIREALEQCELSADQWPPRTIQEAISRAKNGIRTPGDMEDAANDFFQRAIARVYGKYQELLLARNAVDFDDLLMLTARILQQFPDVRAELGDRFRYLLIDEYQDTNHAQYLIASLLASAHRNICATGDPDQSIYAWRGADIRNILDFEGEYPDARIVRLEENFRSTGQILSAASALIAKNERRKAKDLWTRLGDGLPVRVWTCEDASLEARVIAEDIRAQIAEGFAPGDVAIFYRVNALTRVIEQELRQARIPYRIARGVEFYNRREIRDVLAYLRVLVNPADETALLRALSAPSRGIGRTTLARLRESARAAGTTLHDAIVSASLMRFQASSPRPRAAGPSKKLAPFADLLTRLGAMPPSPVEPILEAALELSGLEKSLAAQTDDENDPLANVRELVSAARQFDLQRPGGTLTDWLQEISLISDADSIDQGGGAVTLMTLHTAKGLEFPVVYIVGLEEGLLPHQRSIDAARRAEASAHAQGLSGLSIDEEIEEERRLCFVGMTRARRRLTLSHARYRMTRGVTERKVASRFLSELPREEIERREFEPERDRSRSHLGRYNEGEDAGPGDFSYYPGQRVRHGDYGEGEVLRIEQRGRTHYIYIHFAGEGERAFALEHAPLYVIE